MKPLDIQPVGRELAIKWEDGSETFISLEKLRHLCPCAGCRGEKDIMGNVYGGTDRPLVPLAFELRSLSWVGTYGIQPIWADGHATGIFSFDYLKQLAEQNE